MSPARLRRLPAATTAGLVPPLPPHTLPPAQQILVQITNRGVRFQWMTQGQRSLLDQLEAFDKLAAVTAELPAWACCVVEKLELQGARVESIGSVEVQPGSSRYRQEPPARWGRQEVQRREWRN